MLEKKKFTPPLEVQQLLSSPNEWKLIDRFELQREESAAPLPEKTVEKHPQREMMLTLSGEYDYLLDECVIHCTPGTLLLIDSKMPHECRYVDVAAPLLHLWAFRWASRLMVIRTLRISREGMEKIAERVVPLNLSLYIDHCWDEYNRADPVKRPLIAQQLKVFLACAFMPIFDIGNYYSKAILPRLEMITDKIRNNLAHKPSVAKLAKSAGYSQFYFARLFKEYSGMTINEYIDQCRLQELENLTKDGCYGKDIADKLGFRSLNSFYRWRQHHGFGRKKTSTSPDKSSG